MDQLGEANQCPTCNAWGHTALSKCDTCRIEVCENCEYDHDCVGVPIEEE